MGQRRKPAFSVAILQLSPQALLLSCSAWKEEKDAETTGPRLMRHRLVKNRDSLLSVQVPGRRGFLLAPPSSGSLPTRQSVPMTMEPLSH